MEKLLNFHGKLWKLSLYFRFCQTFYSFLILLWRYIKIITNLLSLAESTTTERQESCISLINNSTVFVINYTYDWTDSLNFECRCRLCQIIVDFAHLCISVVVLLLLPCHCMKSLLFGLSKVNWFPFVTGPKAICVFFLHC
jgi:hypothetical protein